ncbi:hypothetical protein ABB55_01485 [Prosthecomicrobium hirschii]|uniref:Glycosyltransferase RgtA/B/C/D-like domain-containing protein n=2 Tax=Prosthecodimorpha hirschii TaxID=665126 RepID=A0A0P6VJ12_9HYPH|nr:hypothetical protein ABB55_01485 [Prosthecomicrobium hirschii]
MATLARLWSAAIRTDPAETMSASPTTFAAPPPPHPAVGAALPSARLSAPRAEAGLAVLLIALAGLQVARGMATVFPLDDAYIVLHNAQVLLAGGVDPNFAEASALVGSTSPLHLILVAALGLILPLPAGLTLLAFLGAFAYGCGLIAAARRGGAGEGGAFAFALAGLLAAHSPFQLLNGLETGLAMAAVMWALVLYGDAATGAMRRWLLWILIGILPILRPELAVLGLLLGACDLWRMRDEAGGATRTAVRRALPYAVAAGLIVAPFLVWQWVDTGTVLPGTIGAKKAWFAETDLPIGLKARSFITDTTQFLAGFGLTILPALLLLPATAAGRIGAVFAAIVLALYFHEMPGGLSHNEQRYLHVFAPVVMFGAAGLFWAGPERFGAIGRMPNAVAAVLALQAALLALPGLARYRDATAFTAGDLDRVARHAREALPANARLLIHDAGYIAWATTLPLVDMVGLKTPSSIADHRALTLPSNGTRRGEAIARIAARGAVSHAVVLDDWNDRFGIVDGLIAAGWTVTPTGPAGAYRIYRLTPPTAPAAAPAP